MKNKRVAPVWGTLGDPILGDWGTGEETTNGWHLFGETGETSGRHSVKSRSERDSYRILLLSHRQYRARLDASLFVRAETRNKCPETSAWHLYSALEHRGAARPRPDGGGASRLHQRTLESKLRWPRFGRKYWDRGAELRPDRARTYWREHLLRWRSLVTRYVRRASRRRPRREIGLRS